MKTPKLTTAPRRWLLLILVSLLPFSHPVWAHVTAGSNCRGCHGTAKNGMALANFLTVTNLGAGPLKVFKVSPGQTNVIQLNVTNNYGGNYGLNINGLSVAGVTNAADHLVYTADPTWANRSTYFTVGPTTTNPKLWTFNLAVAANTPADTYVLQTQMAGLDSTSVMWSQIESFYVQVVPNPPPTPLVSNPKLSGTVFSLKVPTVAGFTYYLEYKTAVTGSGWTLASQSPGDGTTKTLSDTGATGPQRVYRVRVQ